MASHDGTRVLGHAVSEVTSRTVFRWTDVHNAVFEAFVRSPEWTDVVPKTMVQLDSLVRDLGLERLMGRVNAAGKDLGPIIETKVLSKCYSVARALPILVELRALQLGRGAEYNPLGRFEEAGNTRELLSTGRRYPPVQYPELPLPEDNLVEPNTHSTRRSTPPSAPRAAAQGVCRRPSRDMQASATHFAAPTIANLDINNRVHPLGARKSPIVTRVPAQVNDLNMARSRVLLAESPPASHAPAAPPTILQPNMNVYYVEGKPETEDRGQKGKTKRERKMSKKKGGQKDK